MSTMLDAALGYLDQGLPVFPVCHPAGSGRCVEHHPDKHGPDDVAKYPLVKWGEFQDRLPTRDEVCSWWHPRRWPEANIGLATGRLSGLTVIDLDGSAARAEAERLGLEHGPSATTGRVGGLHRYHAYRPDAPTIFAKTNGIDFRGHGGYALLPPSRHRSGATYTWQVALGAVPLPTLPRWIDDLAAEGRQGPNGVAGVVLGDIPYKTRNATLLSFGGTMRRRGMSQAAIEAALLVSVTVILLP